MATSRTRRSSTSTTARSSSTPTGTTTPTRTTVPRRPSSRSLSPRRKGIRKTDTLSLSQALEDRIHPPSIRPISSTTLSNATYFFASIAFTSFMSRTKTRSMLSLRLHRSSVGTLACFCSPLAWRMFSITSRIRCSHRSKIVNRSCFGTTFRYSWKSLYRSYAFLKMGMSKSFIGYEDL